MKPIKFYTQGDTIGARRHQAREVRRICKDHGLKKMFSEQAMNEPDNEEHGLEIRYAYRFQRWISELYDAMRSHLSPKEGVKAYKKSLNAGNGIRILIETNGKYDQEAYGQLSDALKNYAESTFDSIVNP